MENWDIFVSIASKAAEDFNKKMGGPFPVFDGAEKIERVASILFDLVDDPSELNGPLVNSIVRRVANS